MKHTHPAYILSRELLLFVRDGAPTAEEFIGKFGEQEFHVLRKQGILRVADGRLLLNPDHLSDDGKSFSLGNARYHFDSDTVDLVCRGPAGEMR